MRPGMYVASFYSNMKDVGSGLVVINNGTIHGGDLTYLYTGTYAVYNNFVTARLKVSHYRGPANSVFGPLSIFHLNLEGTATENAFELSGGVAEFPNFKIRISGEKVSELVGQTF